MPADARARPVFDQVRVLHGRGIKPRKAGRDLARRQQNGASLPAGYRRRRTDPLAALQTRNGFSMVKASGPMPDSIIDQVTGAAIGKPSRTRGENVPTAVVPRPLRR